MLRRVSCIAVFIAAICVREASSEACSRNNACAGARSEPPKLHVLSGSLLQSTRADVKTDGAASEDPSTQLQPGDQQVARDHLTKSKQMEQLKSSSRPSILPKAQDDLGEILSRENAALANMLSGTALPDDFDSSWRSPPDSAEQPGSRPHPFSSAELSLLNASKELSKKLYNKSSVGGNIIQKKASTKPLSVPISADPKKEPSFNIAGHRIYVGHPKARFGLNSPRIAGICLLVVIVVLVVIAAPTWRAKLAKLFGVRYEVQEDNPGKGEWQDPAELDQCWVMQDKLKQRMEKVVDDKVHAIHGDSDFLRNIPLFRGLHTDQLKEVLVLFNVEEYRAGQHIFAEGDEGDKIFILISGSVRITKGDTVIATLQAMPDCPVFGESSMLDRKPRSAHATAFARSKVLVLPIDRFWQFTRIVPNIKQRLRILREEADLRKIFAQHKVESNKVTR